MAQQIQLRRGTAAQWSTANPILAQGEMGVETDTGKFKIGDGIAAWSSIGYGGLVGPAQTDSIQSFGDGSDGNVTLSAGTTTLTRSMYYNNLTLTGSAKIVTAGFRVFIKGTLDLSAAGVGAINWNGNSGVGATTQVGGAAGAALVASAVGGSAAGSAGATGVAGVGAVSAAPGAATPSNGGAGGASGVGGTGTSGAGGASGAGGTSTVPATIRYFAAEFNRGASLIVGGAGGDGGASGAGDGGNLGRGGGGGGGGAGILIILANTITKSGATPAGAISAIGGVGGNGATAALGAVGGGGGGGGAGGGWIYLAYNSLAGPVVTDLLVASGGDGGVGGNGFLTGGGGGGGSGGNGGKINILLATSNDGVEVIGSAGAAGSAPSGINGGAAGAGGPCTLSL